MTFYKYSYYPDFSLPKTLHHNYIHNKFLTVAVFMLSISLRNLIIYFSTLRQFLHNYLSRSLARRKINKFTTATTLKERTTS